MNKILIISLCHKRDVLASGLHIANLRVNNPHSEIHLLTFRDHTEEAKLISHITKIHTIDRTKISDLNQGPLFSNGFSLDVFFEGLVSILETQWSCVLNHSNNRIGALISSALVSEQKLGTTITEKGTLRNSDEWALVLNNLNTEKSRSALESPLVISHILGHPWQKSDDIIPISPELSVIASQNFARIRMMKAGNPKLVGVSMGQGYDGTYLEFDVLKEVVTALHESTDTVPVLLIEQGNSQQKQIVNELNNASDNRLVSINIDSTAISSVVSNLDLIVSPGNIQLQVADLMGVESVELRNSSPFIVDPLITTPNSRVIFFQDTESLADSIILSICEMSETVLTLTSMDPSQDTFGIVQDDYGYFFTQIRGEVDLHRELNYHFTRSLLFRELGYPENTQLFNDIRDKCDKEDLKQYSEITRSEMTGTVKILLATLRSLKGIRNQQSNINSFLRYYEQLLAYGEQDSLVGPFIKLAEARIESIESENTQDNLVEIERVLFDLKSSLQKITDVCTRIIQTPEEQAKEIQA